MEKIENDKESSKKKTHTKKKQKPKIIAPVVPNRRAVKVIPNQIQNKYLN
jgi:hypothetical protein